MLEVLEKYGFKQSKDRGDNEGEFQKQTSNGFYLIDIDFDRDMLIEIDAKDNGNYVTLFNGKYIDNTQLDIVLRSLQIC